MAVSSPCAGGPPIVVLLAVLTLLVAGAAVAYWAASGGGSASATTATTTTPLTLSPATPTAQLYPGGQATVVLTVTNPNVGDRPDRLPRPGHRPGHQRLRGGRRALGVRPGRALLHDPDQRRRGLDRPRRRSLAVTLTNALSMATTAANACQGRDLHGLPARRRREAAPGDPRRRGGADHRRGARRGPTGAPTRRPVATAAAAATSVNQGATPTASVSAQSVTVSWAATHPGQRPGRERLPGQALRLDHARRRRPSSAPAPGPSPPPRARRTTCPAACGATA